MRCNPYRHDGGIWGFVLGFRIGCLRTVGLWLLLASACAVSAAWDGVGPPVAMRPPPGARRRARSARSSSCTPPRLTRPASDADADAGAPSGVGADRARASTPRHTQASETGCCYVRWDVYPSQASIARWLARSRSERSARKAVHSADVLRVKATGAHGVCNRNLPFAQRIWRRCRRVRNRNLRAEKVGGAVK